MGGDIHRELNDALKETADPVRRDAERLALTQIRNMPRSPRWAGMRIGVSVSQGLVYMVPAARARAASRRTSYKRPNLADLLLDRAMDPALEQNAAKIEKSVDRMLGRLAGENGFV